MLTERYDSILASQETTRIVGLPVCIDSFIHQQQAEYAVEKERNRETARQIREKLVEDLLAVSRDMKKKATVQKKLADAQKLLERLPALEKELNKAQRELKVRVKQGDTAPWAVMIMWRRE